MCVNWSPRPACAPLSGWPHRLPGRPSPSPLPDLSSVFADADLLMLTATSPDDGVSIGFVRYMPKAELRALAPSRGTAVTPDDERGGIVSESPASATPRQA